MRRRTRRSTRRTIIVVNRERAFGTLTRRGRGLTLFLSRAFSSASRHLTPSLFPTTPAYDKLPSVFTRPQKKKNEIVLRPQISSLTVLRAHARSPAPALAAIAILVLVGFVTVVLLVSGIFFVPALHQRHRNHLPCLSVLSMQSCRAVSRRAHVLGSRLLSRAHV